MMMTEAEAAMKRCPMSFGASQGVSVGGYSQLVPMPSGNYGAGAVVACHHAPLNCIGSACMAWRETVAAYPGDVAGVDTSTGAKYYLKGTQKPAQGVCGLVGRS